MVKDNNGLLFIGFNNSGTKLADSIINKKDFGDNNLKANNIINKIDKIINCLEYI